MTTTRRHLLALAGGCLAHALPAGLRAPPDLPFSTRFKGEDRFHSLVNQAKSGNWAALPISARPCCVG